MLNLAFNCPKKIDEFNRTGKDFHCASCDKKIHDFRGQSNDSIHKVLEANKETTCGIISLSQLGNQYQFRLSNVFFRAFVFVFFLGMTSQVIFGQELDNSLATPAYISEYPMRTISGTVRDEDSLAIPFARLTIDYNDKLYYARTDFDGDYKFQIDVSDTAKFELLATAIGYDSTKVVGINFLENDDVKVDVNLYSSDAFGVMIGIMYTNTVSLLIKEPYEINKKVIRFDD